MCHLLPFEMRLDKEKDYKAEYLQKPIALDIRIKYTYIKWDGRVITKVREILKLLHKDSLT
jgi:hypothetical protein